MNAEIVLGWDKIQASSTVSAYGNFNGMPSKWNPFAIAQVWPTHLAELLLALFVTEVCRLDGAKIKLGIGFGFTIWHWFSVGYCPVLFLPCPPTTHSLPIASFSALQSVRFFLDFKISFSHKIQGSYVCLTSVVLVDMIGVDRLTNAFGLLLFIQGIATFVGPPMAGKLYDLTLRYDWTFVLCGFY